MCTIGATKINSKVFIFKNRDKLDNEEEKVEKINGSIFIRSKNSRRIAAGVNQYGVAFVRAEIVPIAVIKEVYQNKFKVNLINSSIQNSVAEVLFPVFGRVKTANEAVNFIKDSGLFFEPSNVIFADKKTIFSLEIENKNMEVKEIFTNICKTNHFLTLKFGPESYDDYPSSFERFKYANGGIGNITNFEQLKEFLSNHNNNNADFNLCRHHISSTISSCIINVNNNSVWYCKSSPCKGKYELFT
ncbi:MAG: hypothetical protein ABIH82_03900 [Candidatus Woesearchaeota archaeon]